MTKHARLTVPDAAGNRTAFDVVAGDPAARFHPTIAAEFVVVPNGVVDGSVLRAPGMTWTHPEPVGPVAPLATARRLQVSPPEFMLLFASAERIALRQARGYAGQEAALRQAALVIDDWFAIIEDPRLTFVDLARPDTLSGLGFLVACGILTDARAAEIATGLPAGGAA